MKARVLPAGLEDSCYTLYRKQKNNIPYKLTISSQAGFNYAEKILLAKYLNMF